MIWKSHIPLPFLWFSHNLVVLSHMAVRGAENVVSGEAVMNTLETQGGLDDQPSLPCMVLTQSYA